jgi:hypothetical protein
MRCPSARFVTLISLERCSIFERHCYSLKRWRFWCSAPRYSPALKSHTRCTVPSSKTLGVEPGERYHSIDSARLRFCASASFLRNWSDAWLWWDNFSARCCSATLSIVLVCNRVIASISVGNGAVHLCQKSRDAKHKCGSQPFFVGLHAIVCKPS